MKYPVIADSGANYHMFKEREFFETLRPATGSVILGDGTTTVSIKGIGTVKCTVDSHLLTIPNVRYIPGLSESVYSLFQHIKTPNHGLKSTFDDRLYLNFPDFQTKTIIGSNDIYVDMLPLSLSQTDSTTSVREPICGPPTYCCNITDLNTTSDDDLSSNNILADLRKYYDEVKTKRQLGLDVPAGFRSTTTRSKQLILHTPPRKSAQKNVSCLQESISTPVHDTDHISTTPLHSNVSTNLGLLSNVNHGPDDGTHPYIPLIRSVDKPSSSLPQNISMSEDYIRSCVGFRRIDTLKRHIQSLYQPTESLDHTPPDAILDPGYYATQRKKDRNTTPVTRPTLGKKTPHFTPFLPILWQCWVRKVGIMSGHPIALWGP